MASETLLKTHLKKGQLLVKLDSIYRPVPGSTDLARCLLGWACAIAGSVAVHTWLFAGWPL